MSFSSEKELQVGSDYPEVKRIQSARDAKWIRVESLTNPYIRQSLMLDIDRGEAAAIALALELGINQVLMDETDGRATAKKPETNRYSDTPNQKEAEFRIG